MATIGVLKEAIAKLRYNNGVLLQKIAQSNTAAQVAKLRQQIAQNESMILDYEYRIKNNLG